MGHTKCNYNYLETGAQGFFDGSTYETLILQKPLLVNDDFVGADVVIPAAGSPESGCKWVKKIVGAAPPTVVKAADGVNGLVTLSLTADDQKQDAALNMNDELMLSIEQGTFLEARLAFTTLPTIGAIASFGLWGAWADGGALYRVGFEVPAGGVVTCETDDNTTDTSAATTTTLVAGTYYIFKIDCTNLSNIKFYIDGNEVAETTDFAITTAKAQPHVGLYKASGAGLGVISLDYIKIWQDRS